MTNLIEIVVTATVFAVVFGWLFVLLLAMALSNIWLAGFGLLWLFLVAVVLLYHDQCDKLL